MRELSRSSNLPNVLSSTHSHTVSEINIAICINANNPDTLPAVSYERNWVEITVPTRLSLERLMRYEFSIALIDDCLREQTVWISFNRRRLLAICEILWKQWVMTKVNKLLNISGLKKCMYTHIYTLFKVL